MGTCGARLRLAQARLAAAICAAGPGDNTGKRSGYRLRTAARLSRITWTFSAMCVAGDCMASTALRTVAGPAVGHFGAVGKDSYISERRGQARVPNGDIAGSNRGGVSGGAGQSKAPSCRACRLMWSAAGWRNRWPGSSLRIRRATRRWMSLR